MAWAFAISRLEAELIARCLATKQGQCRTFPDHGLHDLRFQLILVGDVDALAEACDDTTLAPSGM